MVIDDKYGFLLDGLPKPEDNGTPVQVTTQGLIDVPKEPSVGDPVAEA